MPIDPFYHKVFADVASHTEMFELLNIPVDASLEDRMTGACYAGRWFEIEQRAYDEMFEVLPPLFIGRAMFALSEMKAGSVGSVFFEIEVAGRKRWFHGYCDLGDPGAPDRMRAAILLRETGDTSHMSRSEKLEAVWSTTHSDFRGLAGELNPTAWPRQHPGKRTVLVYVAGIGTTLQLLEDLTDEEIQYRLPHRRTP